MTYRNFDSGIWTDIKKLAKLHLPVETQLIYLFLMTGPYVTLGRSQFDAVAAEVRIPEAAFHAAIGSLIEVGFVEEFGPDAVRPTAWKR